MLSLIPEKKEEIRKAFRELKHELEIAFESLILWFAKITGLGHAITWILKKRRKK